ncbi:MAG: aminopeptidase N [Alphaproteobacteria bacterium]|nr:aminopeptidase N [Alphaproteobacteria bacterium]
MSENKMKYLKDYKKPDYKIRNIDLTFDLDAENTIVTAKTHFIADYDVTKGGRVLTLDGRDLELLSVKISGDLVDERAYELTDESLTIYNPPCDFVLEVVTKIHPKANTALEGLYYSNGTLCTQNEPEGFRKITYYLDHPDIMASFKTTLIANRKQYPILLSNGNPGEDIDLGDGRHKITWIDPFKKPCYLFAVVAGDLAHLHDTFTTMSGREVKLGIYTEHGFEHQAKFALDSLKRAMKWDEDVFGCEYDLDLFNIVAVSYFNMGAMENKGLNIFNTSCALVDPECGTDKDFAHVESVIAHEYFHNWSGDRVTARDWFNLSLKEGFTVYRDQEFSRDMHNRSLNRINDVFDLRTFQFPEDAGPLAHSVRPESYMEINNYYTSTVYDKGAEVIRMYERMFGKEGFINGCKLYFNRHDGQAVTIDDFAKCQEDVSYTDLTQFKRWYSQAGTPIVNAYAEYDENAKTYRLTLKQHTNPTLNQPEKLPFVIPVEIGLIDKKGNDILLQLDTEDKPLGTSRTLILDQEEQVFTFVNVPERPVLSGNRDFTAPIHFVYDYTDDELVHQSMYDSDLFNRWDASQQYAVKMMKRMMKDYQNGNKTPDVDNAFVELWGKYLLDKGVDPAYKARLITLPQENYLADKMDVVDVEAIHVVRALVKKTLATKYREDLIKIYNENDLSSKPYKFTTQDAGKRSLKNMALSFLGNMEIEENDKIVQNQYYKANNMTDKLAAMNICSNSKDPKRDEIMEDFYEHYKHDAGIVNKWLFACACADREDALEQVKKLMLHPAFEMKNPNKLRSVMGGFAYNQPQYHKADGSGYKFAAEMAMKVDEFNPQMACHIVKPMVRWRRFDEKRQNMMKAALEQIIAKPKLSKNVFELVSKALADETK